MAWISFLLLMFSLRAQELPRFLTKHSPASLRFISHDGKYAYLQNKPGVLSLVSGFRSTDFLILPEKDEFIVTGSRFRERLIIESIPNAARDLSLLKNHKIHFVDFGQAQAREVGEGRNPRLHLNDEWMSYYDVFAKKIIIQNLVTQKKYEITLSLKANPFFIPDVEMISPTTIAYTDINEAGASALISFNLKNKKSNIHFKSPLTGTRLELCQSTKYLAVGEFPYDGVIRGSKIQIAKRIENINLSAMSTIYQSANQDIGNIICLPDDIFFIKTTSHLEKINFKTTEAAHINIKKPGVNLLTKMKNLSQLYNIDGKVLVPYRGEFLVLKGKSNLSEEILSPIPSEKGPDVDN